MALSLPGLGSRPTTFVLTIGDDSAVLTRVVRGQVADAWVTSPDPTEGFGELREALHGDSRTPVAVLIDVLEQKYKEEAVPRVSVLDQAKVVRRHLTVAFPGQGPRAQLALGRTPDNQLRYLFAAVTMTAELDGWLDQVNRLPNPTTGVFLLPMEALELLQALAGLNDTSVPARRDRDDRRRWRVLISHHITGGLRIVVERNGEMALTRLTQPPTGNAGPEESADLLRRDFAATVSYIKRLGYRTDDPLELVVLGGPNVVSAIRDLKLADADSLVALTPAEAAAKLGVGQVGSYDSPYADVLQALWFARKRKRRLQLTTAGKPEFSIRKAAYQVAPLAAAVSALAVVGFGVNGYLQLMEKDALLEARRSVLADARDKAAVERARLASLQPFDARVMRTLLELDAELRGTNLNVLEVFRGFERVLRGQGLVTQFNLQRNDRRVDPDDRRRNRNAPEPTPRDLSTHLMNAEVQLPDEIRRPGEAMTRARAMVDELGAQLGDRFVVELARPPVALDSEGQLSPEDLRIRGPGDDPFDLEITIYHLPEAST